MTSEANRDVAIKERIARHLFTITDHSFSSWENAPETLRSYLIDEAVTILEEMRVPTIPMILSCAVLPCSQQDMWERSINAAITEVVTL
jgi:hypothetical protein